MSSAYCPSSGSTLTSSSGSISDGYGSYDNGEYCFWIIAPSGASSVTLTFTSFSTESSYDKVYVYSCATSSCSSTSGLYGSPFSGSYSSSFSVTSTTGIMKVVFTSDGSSTYSGFEATYSTGGSSSSCSTGQYLGSYGYCYSCSNKPSNSYYTSSGSSSSGCSWSCSSGYYQSGSSCYSSSSSSSCSTGQYLDSGGYCYSCTNKPSNSYYTSSGSSSSGCLWNCNPGYYQSDSYCYYDSYYYDSTSTAANESGSQGGVAALGVVLLPILLIAIFLRAKNSPEARTAEENHLKDACCACCGRGYQLRLGVLIASGVLAVVVLGISIGADSTCIPAAKFRLSLAAYFINLAGGIGLYSSSGCGCTLCCACSPGGCNRTTQATSAIGVSIFFWWIAQVYFVFIIEVAGIASAFWPSESSCPTGLLPKGVVVGAGIFSAASFVLQGHFTTLVPEALSNLHPTTDGSGGVELAATSNPDETSVTIDPAITPLYGNVPMVAPHNETMVNFAPAMMHSMAFAVPYAPPGVAQPGMMQPGMMQPGMMQPAFMPPPPSVPDEAETSGKCKV